MQPTSFDVVSDTMVVVVLDNRVPQFHTSKVSPNTSCPSCAKLTAHKHAGKANYRNAILLYNDIDNKYTSRGKTAPNML